MQSKDICLVSLPWASTNYPSMAIGALKPILKNEGFSVIVKYYNLFFSELLGLKIYEELCQEQTNAIGEQAFADILYPKRNNDDEFNKFITEAVDYNTYKILVKQVDEFIELCSNELLNVNPKVIGFTTTFYQKIASIALAKRLKDKGYTGLIILGGAACEYPMGRQLIKEFDWIDYIFEGEAEVSLPKFLAEKLRKNKKQINIQGVISKESNYSFSENEGIKNLSNELPDHTDYIQYLKLYQIKLNNSLVISYEASRGCWWGQKHHCTFCGLNGGQIAYREKKAEKIINDLKQIRLRYGPSIIHFTDNIVPHNIFKKILPQLSVIKDQSYFMEVKSNLTEEDFQIMKKANVKEIQPGIERLSDEALKIMNKGTSAIRNIQTLKYGEEYGLFVSWNLLLGFVDETEAGIREEMSIINKIRHLRPPGSVAFLRMDRYSPNYENAKKLGYNILGPSRAEKFLFYNSSKQENLAYHFDYKFVKEPLDEVKRLWSVLINKVSDWQTNFRKQELIQINLDKELLIQDSRFDHEMEYILTSEDLKLFKFISSIQTKHNIDKYFPRSSKSLEFFEQHDLLVKVNDQYLSLPLRHNIVNTTFH